jgi:hypothetical protein
MDFDRADECITEGRAATRYRQAEIETLVEAL